MVDKAVLSIKSEIISELDLLQFHFQSENLATPLTTQCVGSFLLCLGYISTDRPFANEYIVIYYDNYEYFTVHALNCQSGG